MLKIKTLTKNKNKEQDWMKDDSAESVETTVIIEYPPASCIKCETDMSLQGRRRWLWDGKKLNGPVCKDCLKK